MSWGDPAPGACALRPGWCLGHPGELY